jgi:hypothetical protein
MGPSDEPAGASPRSHQRGREDRRSAGAPNYARRRAVALAALAGLALFAYLALAGGSGEQGSGPVGEGSPAATAEPVEVTVSVSGDLLIHSPVWFRALELGGGSYDFEPMLARIKPLVERADIAVCHLETPLTEGEPSGFPLFAAPAPLADAIAATGWRACTTASNHTLDRGLQGIRETLEILDGAGVLHAGSAGRRREARDPLILEANGMRVALLAYTFDTNGLPVPDPWAINVFDLETVIDDARRASEAGADAVLVNVHWGSEAVAEYSPEPSATQRRLVRRLTAVDEITAVVGQGPHVVQPIERVNGKPVVFSEGNLLSNQSAACCDAASQDGLIAELTIRLDETGASVPSVSYVPVWVSQPDYTVLPVARALRRGWADEAALTDSWQRTVSVAGKGRGIGPQPRRLP